MTAEPIEVRLKRMVCEGDHDPSVYEFGPLADEAIATITALRGELVTLQQRHARGEAILKAIDELRKSPIDALLTPEEADDSTHGMMQAVTLYHYLYGVGAIAELAAGSSGEEETPNEP